MYKRLRDLIAFLANLQQLGVLAVVVGVLAVILSVVTGIASYLVGIASQNVQLNLPLFAVIAIAILAMSPVVKTVQAVFRPLNTFEFGNLRWQPRRIWFLDPIRLWPHCGRGLIYEVVPPSIQMIGVGGTDRFRIDNKFIYECAIHGPLGVQQEPREVLAAKARLSQQR
jgi:hypothetical protein